MSAEPLPNSQRLPFTLVIACGYLIWLLLAWITWRGATYQYEIPNVDRPIASVTLLYLLATLISLIALHAALRIRNPTRHFFVFLILFAVAFRLVQLFSPPFQEIDHYRYLWDGMVTAQGHSPYKYSPHEILYGHSEKEDFQQLQKLASKSESSRTILSRIHFARIRTLYPPVSQAVFAATVSFLPDGASVSAHVFAIKTAMSIFDLGTLFLLACLLARLRLHPGWSMVWGWNPLVIKEFSNSGHLDSIAVFFVTLSILLFVLHLQSSCSPKNRIGSGSKLCLGGSAVALGLGFSAKIFPLILMPLLVTVSYRHNWKNGLLFSAALGFFSILSFAPMALEIRRLQATPGEQVVDEETLTPSEKEGLQVFLKNWQMNEFAYMLVYQNLKPVPEGKTRDVAWFRLLNESTRQRILNAAVSLAPGQDPPNLVSRLVTLGLFAFAYLWLLFRTLRSESQEPARFLEDCFWVIALFFCLQPTQNPWYWTWAIPLLPFARNRAWLLYSPLLLLYYLRFWLANMEGPFHFAGMDYSGVGFFDFVVVWIEHAPLFVALLFYRLFMMHERTNPPGNGE